LMTCCRKTMQARRPAAAVRASVLCVDICVQGASFDGHDQHRDSARRNEFATVARVRFAPETVTSAWQDRIGRSFGGVLRCGRQASIVIPRKPQKAAGKTVALVAITK
jgi:hypothetical protein